MTENNGARCGHEGDPSEAGVEKEVNPVDPLFRCHQIAHKLMRFAKREFPFNRLILHSPALFTIPPTATPPGPASAAFRSVAHPHRTGEYASGALGRKTPHLQDLTASRYGRMVNKAGFWLLGGGSAEMV